MRNRYEVPQKTWRKWVPLQQAVFNRMYRKMKEQTLLIHPETHPLHPVEWDTIRWNAAWLAAESCVGKSIKLK